MRSIALLASLLAACVEPRAVVVATGQDHPTALLADGAAAYWTLGGALAGAPAPGRVATVPLGGGPARVIAEGLGVRELAQDESHLYWLQAGPEGATQLVRAPKGDGGPAAVLATEPGPVHALAVDEAHVYFLGASGVHRVPKVEGGTPQAVTLAQVALGGLAVDADTVYFSDHLESVWRAPKAGGAATVLAAGQDKPLEVRADDTHVLWINAGREVLSIPRGGGVPLVLVSLPQGRLAGLAATRGWVYVTSAGDGRVLRVHRQGGEVRAVATGLPQPGAIDAVRRTVVWANDGDGTIRKLRDRPPL